MRLRSPEIEKQIRIRARRELRASKEAWKEYKRMREARSRTTPDTAVHIILILAVPLFLWQLLSANGGPPYVLAALLLYCTGTVFMRAWSLRTSLRSSSEISVFTLLPVEDKEIFDFLWQKSLRSSLVVLYIALVGYSYLAESRLHSSSQWTYMLAASGAAVLQWAVVLLPMVLLVAYVPGWPLAKIGLSIESLILLLLFFPSKLVELLQTALRAVPAGWVAYGFQWGLEQGRIGVLWSLPPLAVLAAATLFALRRIRSHYTVPFGSLRTPYPPASSTTEDEGPEPGPQAETSAGLLDAREAFLPSIGAETIKSGKFVAEAEWEGKGWLEGIVARLLRPAEKVVAEFMLGEDIGTWSAWWRVAAKISALGIAATIVLPLPQDYLWVLYVPLVVLSMLAAPLFGDSWPAFEEQDCGGRFAPLYSGYAVGYSEMSRVMFKINGIRLLAWLPLLLAYVCALALRLNTGQAQGIIIALKVFWLVVAMQPFMVLAHFSKRTNDAEFVNNIRIKTAVVMLSLAVGLIGCVALAIMGFVISTGLALASLVGLAGISLALWTLYGLYYNRGRVDLLRVK